MSFLLCMLVVYSHYKLNMCIDREVFLHIHPFLDIRNGKKHSLKSLTENWFFFPLHFTGKFEIIHSEKRPSLSHLRQSAVASHNENISNLSISEWQHSNFYILMPNLLQLQTVTEQTNYSMYEAIGQQLRAAQYIPNLLLLQYHQWDISQRTTLYFYFMYSQQSLKSNCGVCK